MISLGPLPAVPPLGVGTWQWGDTWFWGFGTDYDRSSVDGAFYASVDAGVRLFDTAEVYGASLLGGLGRSEEILGELVAATDPQDAPRALVATKFFPLTWRLTRGQLVAAARASRARLRVDAIDLYQLHWPFGPRSVETWADAMADAHDQGVIRAIGISNCNLEQMRRVQGVLSERGLALASNQVEYSLLKRGPERSGLLQACADTGVVLMAYSPLAQGLLTGKYGPDRPLSGIRGWRYNRKLDDLAPFLERFEGLAAELDATPAQLALAWAIAKGTLVIPGAKNADQAEQTAGALGVVLDEGHVQELDRLAEQAPSL